MIKMKLWIKQLATGYRLSRQPESPGPEWAILRKPPTQEEYISFDKAGKAHIIKRQNRELGISIPLIVKALIALKNGDHSGVNDLESKLREYES